MKVVSHVTSRRRGHRTLGYWSKVGPLIFLWVGIYPGYLEAVDWPWSKPHELTAQCSLDQKQIERGYQDRLRATVQAKDSRGHALAYSWSSNGGIISGQGPEVEVDVGRLPPGVYSVLAAVQDAQKQRATCSVDFEVLPPPPADSLAMSCFSDPAVVQPGTAVRLKAEATDTMGHALRYQWFPNGGTIQGEGSEVRLDTTGLLSGVYSITGRAEDGRGGASDCVMMVKVEVPPPPAPPPEPVNIAQIVFARNQQTLEASQQMQLERVLARVREEPGGRVSIESYAAPDESEPDKLAAARAETVKRYLLENGVSESQVQILVGLGGRRGGLRNRTLDVIWLPDGLEY